MIDDVEDDPILQISSQTQSSSSKHPRNKKLTLSWTLAEISSFLLFFIETVNNTLTIRLSSTQSGSETNGMEKLSSYCCLNCITMWKRITKLLSNLYIFSHLKDTSENAHCNKKIYKITCVLVPNFNKLSSATDWLKKCFFLITNMG